MFTCDVTKRTLLHAILLVVNYRSFAHNDVSHSFNGENDNVVFESMLIVKMSSETCAPNRLSRNKNGKSVITLIFEPISKI